MAALGRWMNEQVLIAYLAFALTAAIQVAVVAFLMGRMRSDGEANRKAIEALTSRVDQHAQAISALHAGEAIRHPGQQVQPLVAAVGAD